MGSRLVQLLLKSPQPPERQLAPRPWYEYALLNALSPASSPSPCCARREGSQLLSGRDTEAGTGRMTVFCTRKAEARESVQPAAWCVPGTAQRTFYPAPPPVSMGLSMASSNPGGDRGPKSSQTQEEGAAGFWVQVCLTPQAPHFLGTAPLPR